MDSLAGPRDEVGQLVTEGRDLQKSANQSSAVVIQKHVSFIMSRWALLEEQTKKTLSSLQVLLILLWYNIVHM